MEFLESLEYFAEDLFHFVLCECHHGGSPRNVPDDPFSPFRGPLRLAVRRALHGGAAEVVARNALNSLGGSGGAFRLFAVEAAAEVARRPYRPVEFVLFALLLSRLAVLCQAARGGDCSGPAIAAVVEVGRRYRRIGALDAAALGRIAKEVGITELMREF